MLFNKKIEPSCSYCSKGVRINDREVACLRRGVVNAGGSCSKFRYDPLRRQPARPGNISAGKFSEKDFTL